MMDIAHQSTGCHYPCERQLPIREPVVLVVRNEPIGGVVGPLDDIVLGQAQHLFGAGVGEGDPALVVDDRYVHRADTGDL